MASFIYSQDMDGWDLLIDKDDNAKMQTFSMKTKLLTKSICSVQD
jgi:hypothetical protein